MLITRSIILSLLAVFALGVLLFLLLRRRREETRALEGLASAEARGLHLPASLHPVIDTARCMGSLACVRACPEGDILGIVDGSARLIEGARCIGHGRCAAECPVDAIRLVFGTSERGVDLPELSGEFESSRPGVYVVGELGGMGLIKNAITQGVEVVEYLQGRLNRAGDDRVDVCIVGAGPAGLAAAACRAAGLSHRVLEQDTFGGTVAHYPRQKLVMTEKVEIPGYGFFGRPRMRKEEVLERFREIVDRTGVVIEEGVRVEGLEGSVDDFVVHTSRGAVPARRVVFAVGRRGSPRRLGVPGEELPKVAYRLVEPEQYQGTRVLVVGGGDSALEAAIQLAEETDAHVDLSYRGAAFGRCRADNRERIEALVARGRVDAHLETQVAGIVEDAVVLARGETSVRLPNDYVIVNVGGELPSGFLDKVGIAVRRHEGEEAAVARRPEKELEERASRRFALALFTLGLGITAALAAIGWQYYLLPLEARRASPLHAALGSAGWWGHGVGIAATLFMLLNFVYAARKRLGWLRGTGRTRDWLTFHLFVGFMSPVIIAFHAAFQSRNLLATVTAGALAVVVLTGILGRFIWGLLPVVGGRTVALPVLEASLLRHRQNVRDLAPRGHLTRWTQGDPPRGSLVGHLLALPVERLRLRRDLARAARSLPDLAARAQLAAEARALARLRTQVGFHRGLRGLLSGWRAFHVSLAVLMVLVIVAHVAVSLLLGYRWIFS